MTDAATGRQQVTVPAMGLVVLVGVSGSGKSTFARHHFKPTEVVSSDFCRGLVADDENDQSATPDAFDVLHYIVGTRLRRGLLTVVDATNVQQAARASLVKLAKSHDVLVDAIVLDVPESVAVERNRQRPDREFGSHVVSRQHRDLERSLRRLSKEGFRRVHVLRGADQIDAVEIVRERPWNDRRDVHGPFDIIGDVHGCASELRTLLTELGWKIEYDGNAAVDATHPEGRQAVFVGDLVDRGPDTPGVLRLVMGMVASGNAFCVSGNHEAKLVRALRGSKVTVSHGLAESLAQLDSEPEEFRQAGARRSWTASSATTSSTSGTAGRRARRAEGVLPRALVGPGALVRAVRRHHRRDRRVRPARSATRGRRSTAAGRWSSTATPRSRRRSGSTTPSAWTPASSSAASSPRCATPSARSSPSRPNSSGTSRSVPSLRRRRTGRPRCCGSATSPAPAGWRPPTPARSRSPRRTPPPRWRS